LELKRKIEAHFNYKWNNDKSMAITDTKDKNILLELPEDTRDLLCY
jgi:hypothetical protein